MHISVLGGGVGGACVDIFYIVTFVMDFINMSGVLFLKGVFLHLYFLYSCIYTIF